ncbi:MAG: hypothetical protein LBK41_08740 [Clostridiales bacterium]|nr:hypothetical protein [Clostridiales bacterium]
MSKHKETVRLNYPLATALSALVCAAGAAAALTVQIVRLADWLKDKKDRAAAVKDGYVKTVGALKLAGAALGFIKRDKGGKKPGKPLGYRF